MDNSYQNWNKKLLMEEYMNDLNSIIFFFFFSWRENIQQMKLQVINKKIKRETKRENKYINKS